MPSPFAITAAANTVRLDKSRSAVTAFTVTNTSGAARVGRAELRAENPESAAWLTLNGEAQRPFGINEAYQYGVAIAVPPTAPAGSYPFRLDMVGVENPDELYSQGPTVAVEVAAAEPVKRALPSWWWIAALAAAVVLLIGGLVAFLLGRGDDEPGADLQTSLTVANTQAVELDSGAVSSSISPNDDIQYLVEGDDAFIVPLNAARIVKAQTSVPSQADCAAAAKDESAPITLVRVAGANARPGLCVVTTDGRVSEVQVRVRQRPSPLPRPSLGPVVRVPAQFRDIARAGTPIAVGSGGRVAVDAALFGLGQATISFTTRAAE